MVKSCWFLLKWGLLLAIIGVAVGVPYFYRQVDDRIRLRVEETFAAHYADLTVSVRSAEVVKGEGVIVRGLVVAEPGADGAHAELVRFDEIFLACPTDLKHLLSGEPTVSRVVVRRPTLRLTRRGDGSWSAAKLLPLPQFSARPPVVTVENGTIEIFDPLRVPSSTLTLRVNGTMTPPEAPAPAEPRQFPGRAESSRPAAFAGRPGSAAAQPPGPAGAALAEPPGLAQAAGRESRLRSFEMTLTGDHLRRLELTGRIDPHQLRYTVDGSIEGLEISPELRDALPSEFAEKLAVLGALRGQATLKFHVSRDGSAQAPVRFDLSGRLTRGRINDPRLPYPLTDMRASVRMNNEGFAVEHLFARTGQSTIRLSCRRRGYGPTSPVGLEAEVRHLDLNRELLDMPGLPEVLRELWYKYRPFGQIHADVKLEYDGQTWRPEATVQCLDVSFTHYKFPYRLDHGHGTVELNNDLLKVNLEAYSGSQPIRLAAEVLHPTSGPTGWFEAKGDGLPLDKKLFGALNDESRKVFASLSPRGTVNFFFRYWQDEPGGPPHKHLLIGLNRCAICYNRFPYPLSNIRGTLEALDGRWTFRDLEGTNDTARVTCEGHLLPTARDGAAGPAGAALRGDTRLPKELLLRLTATDLPLEEELRDALNPNMQRLWNALKPRGRVDLKGVEIRWLTGQKRLGLTFRAEPRGDSTSIEPVGFPYRLEKLRGALVFSDGHVRLEGLRAEHGHVKLSAGGVCDFRPDGSWRLALEGLSVDRLRLDRELIRAMPERMKKAFTALNPEGPIDLRGRWELQRGGKPDAPLRSRWDLDVSFAGAAVQSGIRLENMHGGLALAGGFDGQHFHCYGQLAVDSVRYRDFQFTQVTGPLWIDDHQALFGSWADRQRQRYESRARGVDHRLAPKRRLRPVTGRIFGGTVYGNAWITLGAAPQYGLQATLADAGLARIAQELITGRQKLQGKVLATLNLRGAGRSLNALSGGGRIQLREADVYELPVMIALLKILSIKRPDTNAFGASDIDYRIAGNHIYFDRIVFNGDAISLEGNGEMNFQNDIRLNLHPLLGREDRNLAVLKELLGGAGQEFMLIRVSGTLQDPQMTKEVFPTVNQALQQLTVGSQGLLPQGSQGIPNRNRGLPPKRY